MHILTTMINLTHTHTLTLHLTSLSTPSNIYTSTDTYIYIHIHTYTYRLKLFGLISDMEYIVCEPLPNDTTQKQGDVRVLKSDGKSM